MGRNDSKFQLLHHSALTPIQTRPGARNAEPSEFSPRSSGTGPKPHSAQLQTASGDAPAAASDDDPTGFAVLVFDRPTLESGYVEQVLEYYDIRGLNPLFASFLSASVTAKVLELIEREDPGRQKVEPALLVPVFDLSPCIPTTDQLRKRPELDNGRLQSVGEWCRKEMGRERPTGAAEPYYTPNRRRAWELVRAGLAEEEGDLRNLIGARREAFTSPFPVLRTLSGKNERAKVEIVDFHGEPAVCKTFRPGKEDAFQRELDALLTLNPRMKEIPQVLGHGENWIVTSLYQHEDERGLIGPLYPLDRAKRFIDTVQRIHEAGYAHLDLHRTNVLFDPRAGLKIVDFEWAFRYPDPPGAFEESYDIAGFSDTFQRLWFGPGTVRRNFKYPWKLEIGLSVRSLREDPEWKQHVKRVIYLVVQLIPRRITGLILHRRVRARLRGLIVLMRPRTNAEGLHGSSATLT